MLTSLTKEAMPVIRYRTRDLTRLLPGTARTMRRMEKITGRSDDMLIIRGVNLFPSQIEELILADARLAPHYVLEVRREQRLDELKVIVEAKAGRRRRADAARPPAQELAQHIKSRIGVTTEVARGRARRGRALARQGQAHHRPPAQGLNSSREVRLSPPPRPSPARGGGRSRRPATQTAPSPMPGEGDVGGRPHRPPPPPCRGREM